MNVRRSTEFLDRLACSMPGAANSNARCGNAIAVREGRGAELIDLDGNTYIDYVLGFGPVFLGHGHPKVSAAVSEAVSGGTSFAFSQEFERRVAESIINLCPSVQMVRLCNSGTEASLTCYRIANAHTGAFGLVKIEGDYNGGFDPLMWDIPGAEAADLDAGPVPGSEGLLPLPRSLVRSVPFNDADALEALLKHESDSIAAVFMEPILGNVAAIMPIRGYLESVRAMCDRYGVVLVFDEVKTGFRVARGGGQQLLGVHADLTMFGKALGNGMPIAAVGGRRELMQLIRPGGVHHCGTYYGNRPCAAAADTVLSIVSELDYDCVMRRGRRLAEGICERLDQARMPSHWHGVGTMFGITLGPDKPRDYRSWWLRTQRKTWMSIAARLGDHGVLTDGFIGLFFMSLAHTDEHIDRTLDACERAIRSHQTEEGTR